MGVSRDCPLCGGPSRPFFTGARSFVYCPGCLYIFTRQQADVAEAEAWYKGQWEGQAWDDPATVAETLMTHYGATGPILDLGSGSGGLTGELRRRGHDVTPVEPMIHGRLDEQPPHESFGVVLMVEVIEHLLDPLSLLDEVDRRARGDALYIVSTFLIDAILGGDDPVGAFEQWWYKDDPTHVGFFSTRSFALLAEARGYDVTFFGDKVIGLKRRG